MGINVEKLRGFGVKVERKVGQNRTEPAHELREIEESQLVNFVFSITRPDGKTFPLRKKDVSAMSKSSYVSVDAPSGETVSSEASVDSIRRSIDASKVRVVAYPGQGNDSRTVRELVQMFPNMEHLVLMAPDVKALHNISPDLSVGWIEDAGVDINATRQAGVLGEGGKIEVDASYGAHDFTIHVYSEDYLAFKSKEMRRGVDVLVVKQPGQSGELSYDERFYEKVERETKKGGVVLVRQAKTPKTKKLAEIQLDTQGIPAEDVYWMWKAYRRT